MIDQDTEFGARAAAHLRDDPVIWLTSVSPGGAPLPTPVWFLWDGDRAVQVFSLPRAKRVAHVEANPNVALQFGGDGQGGDIVVFSGHAVVDVEAPPADGVPAFLDKYRNGLERLGMTPEAFAQRYSAALRVTLTRLRGH